METNVKYTITQSFTKQDWAIVKTAVKGRQQNSQGRKQIPSTFFIMFAILALIAYLGGHKGQMGGYLFLCIVSVIVLYYTTSIDEEGVLLYQLVFARCQPHKTILYDHFMECYDLQQQGRSIAYEDVKQVYELKQMIIIALKQDDYKYVLLAKRAIPMDTLNYIRTQFKDCLQEVSEKEGFKLP